MSKPRRFDWLFRPQMADEDLPLSAEARFAEALAELPAVERSALALSEIGGLDTDEIAERLGTDPAVVHKLLTRARESVRASLALRGHRGLAALLPFQNLWQLGSSAPVVRAAGVVAAAILAPTVVTGGASADSPPQARSAVDPPRVRALVRTERALPTVSRQGVAVAAAGVARAAGSSERATPPAGSERRSVRPGPGLQRERDAAVVAPVSPRQAPPPEQAAPPERPAPPAAEPEREPPTKTVANTVARTLPVPPVLPPVAPPVELPVDPPPLPVEPPPLPAPPPVPPLPLPPLPPLPLPPGLPVP